MINHSHVVLPPDLAVVKVEGDHRAYTWQEIEMLRRAAGMNIVPPVVIAREQSPVVQQKSGQVRQAVSTIIQ